MKRQFSVTEECTNNSSGTSDVRGNKTKRGDSHAASQRHIKTEQARRDKISAGFQSLQELLPGKERVEKAMLLTQAADYITQLQSVLQTLLENGSVSKLPDELQWQIRTLLPRKDGKVLPCPSSAPKNTLPPTPIVPTPSRPAAPILAPLSIHPRAGLQNTNNEKSVEKGEEGVMFAQLQSQLEQLRQQAAAAQVQSWQQAITALQIQQALQQHAGPILPELLGNVTGSGGENHFQTGLPLFQSQSSHMSGTQKSCKPSLPENIQPVAPPTTYKPQAQDFESNPLCRLQQLCEVATSEPSSLGAKAAPHSPTKARKNIKVRRHTTAAKIPKPDSPSPARVGPGRPEPV